MEKRFDSAVRGPLLCGRGNYNTMSVTWQNLLHLTEASEKDRLLTHIAGAYGEHAADQVRDKIEKSWSPEGLQSLYKDLVGRFTDPKTREIMNKAAEKMGTKPSASAASGAAVRKKKPGEDLGKATSAIGGPSRKDRIAGLSSGDYVNPADFAKQQASTAATAASRPDRAGTQMDIPAMKPSTVKPGERPHHDIGLTPSFAPGSAPGHTRPVQKQVSQQGDKAKTVGQQMDYLQGLLDKEPDHPQADKIHKALAYLQNKPEDELLQGPTPVVTNTASDLEGGRKSIEQLKQRYNTLPALIKQMAHQAVQLRQSNPTKSRTLAQQVGQMRKEYDLIPAKIRSAEQGVSRITQTGKTGLADAQRKVDAVSKAYPGLKHADKLAKKLGVPPTSVRTKKFKDPDTGKEVERTAIWSAEKIDKWRESGPELEPGTYDIPGMGPKLPTEPDPERQRGGEDKLHKPMMKAPKGLSDEETMKLADLRREYQALKKSGAEQHELALKKDEIDAIMAKGGEIVSVVMPGRDGMTLRTNGLSQDVRTMRPDKTTGNMIRGTRTIDPSKTGQTIVWSDIAKDWVLPSQKITLDAEKGAAARAGGAVPHEPKTGERRPHMSQAQMVKGTPVSTNATQQKAQAANSTIPDKDVNLHRMHRQNKDLVHQAYGLKKPKSDEDDI